VSQPQPSSQFILHSFFIHSVFIAVGLRLNSRRYTVTQKESEMKNFTRVLISAGLVVICLPACAGHKGHSHEYARVVAAKPVYETVRFPVDEEVCWVEQGWRGPRHSAAPVIAGAVLGGVVGNSLAHGHGKAVSTLAGAAVGGAIAYGVTDHSRHRGYRPAARTRCEIQRSWRTETRIAAWDVTYRYHGDYFHIRTREEPGKKIRVPTRW
jgi:uncharacterized protein YcfJ